MDVKNWYDLVTSLILATGISALLAPKLSKLLTEKYRTAPTQSKKSKDRTEKVCLKQSVSIGVETRKEVEKSGKKHDQNEKLGPNDLILFYAFHPLLKAEKGSFWPMFASSNQRRTHRG